MAKNSATVFLNFALILSAMFLFISMAEGGRLFTGLFRPPFEAPGPKCDQVHGVRLGDTCFDVAKQFKLTTELFGSINPNLECDHLFVGQWLCIAGTPN